ncbi:MAG: hypothetical protein NTV77_00675 [Candidatus Azambacteria bacterium]|nr:hypothetical protein [Candidatus Azambacteria bacterium]
MPLVVVNRNPGKLGDKLLEELVANLPESVASSLTTSDLCPEGKLTAQDVEVWVLDFGPHDINTKDVEIIIWANLYPERQKNLDFRRDILYRMVRLILPEEIKGFVWILLQPASFGEF